ncbi:MAG: hypothetical protein LW768_09670 [Rubrivivax sp.]|jgi:hypothetical protein|nr:hypothetical protein [Rubrivivax sp.]
MSPHGTFARSAGIAGSLLALLAAALPALAQTRPAVGGIYTCVDDRGRRLTSDRPIIECIAKEQQILNRDGSLRAVHPPTLTADERAEKEARDRAAAEARAQLADAARRDRNLMARYPTEAAHQRAREAALDTARLAQRASEIRLRDLTAERKPLLDELEFYAGRQPPAKLKAALDANEVSAEAQRQALVNQEAELVRINRFYDLELDRLRRLWAGATPGTLGAIPGNTTAPASGAAPR